jgi:hypothetical protein
METLVALYENADGVHPVVRAAWLHHRFVTIHPFQDGNGRVARALTLMVLLQAGYAPLVVDRNQRSDYIDALDTANDGDLRPLVRLFAGLELVALKSELSAPLSGASQVTGAVPVARELVGRLRDRRRTEDEERAAATDHLAAEVQMLVSAELDRLRVDLEAEFRTVDPQAWGSVTRAAPTEEKGLWWRGQIVYTARKVDFFADLSVGTWWTALHLNALGQALRYLVFVQKVGRGDRGVLAVTTLAEVVERDRAAAAPGPPQYRRAFEPQARDSVTLVHTNSAQDRWPEVAELIDRTMSTALRFFVDELS